MTDWITKLVVGQGNVIQERSFTNWNTFDASKVVEEKKREKSSSVPASADPSARSNEDANTESE
jgi:hypothetical protein